MTDEEQAEIQKIVADFRKMAAETDRDNWRAYLLEKAAEIEEDAKLFTA